MLRATLKRKVLVLPPLWSKSNNVAFHPTDLDSILGRFIFVIEDFFNFRTFRSQSSLGIICPPLTSKTIFIRTWTGTVSDFRCSTWPTFNKIKSIPILQLHYYSSLLRHGIRVLIYIPYSTQTNFPFYRS